MEYEILNKIVENIYIIRINGYPSLSTFNFIERTQRQNLEIINAKYINTKNDRDNISVPVYKVYESNIFRFIEKEINEGLYEKINERLIELQTRMTGCIIHLKVPDYMKYNPKTNRFDIKTDRYSLFAYELEEVEIKGDIDGKLQRIVLPNLV